MSLFLPDPVAPGTVDPGQLAQVRELHTAVRNWLEESARQQKNAHIPANLPYADLMFALGFATLGDHDTAKKLVEDARRVMEGPIPPKGRTPQEQLALVAALARNFLFKALRFRAEQALIEKSHHGPLSAGLLAELDGIIAISGYGPVNNPHKLAAHVINKARAWFRALEPSERVDPYADWTKHGDALAKARTELATIRDATALEAQIRRLYWTGLEGKNLAEVQFYVLADALALSDRMSADFNREFLEWAPGTLRIGNDSEKESPDLPKKQGEMLERAFLLSLTLNRSDHFAKLSDAFRALIAAKPEPAMLKLLSVTSPAYLRCLIAFGRIEELGRFITDAEPRILAGVPIEGWRARCWNSPERWASLLCALLNLTPGWLQVRQPEKAKAIADLVRGELVKPTNPVLRAKEYTDLARSSVTALGHGTGAGLAAITELFGQLDPKKITNTWTTAQYYSQFHMNLVEDAVRAACNLCLDNPVPVTVIG